jgi:hypothetical protein
LLYDLGSGKSTDLATVMPTGWHLDSAVALDDQGRILVTADTLNQGNYQVHSFLLTPAGQLSDPTPVPEPTALATLLLGLAGIALRHRRGRNQ